MIYVLLVILAPLSAFANPYPDPLKVPQDQAYEDLVFSPVRALDREQALGEAVLRIDVAWQGSSEQYAVTGTYIEYSGTLAYQAKVQRPDALGSYRGRLVSLDGEPLAYASVGTGKEFRLLTRAMSLRFPVPNSPVKFIMEAEHPQSGDMTFVLQHPIDPGNLTERLKTPEEGFETYVLREAKLSPKLIIGIYAEGYLASRKAAFYEAATRTIQVLERNNLPMIDHLEFRAVFHPSRTRLGEAQDMGENPVPRDSFLGLYFPHWHKFGRWYNIVYATDEVKLRDGLAMSAYDHPIVLIDDNRYWGVGNFNEITAVPAGSGQFEYLLMHELGHYFGLNEEYSSGGPTELAFAPGIHEPWSQNITFTSQRENLKWLNFVRANTPVPTPSSKWRNSRIGPWGAYKGGYASTDPKGRARIPGLSCRMATGSAFCPICLSAIEARFRYDAGL